MRKLHRCYLLRRWLFNGVILAACGVLSALSGSSQTTAKTSAQASVSRTKSAQDYGKLPLAFEANRGQSNPGVKFLS